MGFWVQYVNKQINFNKFFKNIDIYLWTGFGVITGQEFGALAVQLQWSIFCGLGGRRIRLDSHILPSEIQKSWTQVSSFVLLQSQ